MISFNPGPSELYFTVADHLRKALREGVPSASHRSTAFEGWYRSCAEGLQTLLGLPEGYHMAFTGSATEIWERSLQSLVQKESLHFVNGAFSKRYGEIADQLGVHTTKVEVAAGQSFDGSNLPRTSPELVALTWNETSTGVTLNPSFLAAVRKQYPEALIAVDAVSALPHAAVDYTMADMVFFSVQKGFGLPAGLGVWLYNNRCVEKVMRLRKAGHSAGTYHALDALHTNGLRWQTPETPNVLGIYLLSNIVQDFLRRGIQAIRNETEYKAAILYQALDQHAVLKPFVQQPSDRSRTVVTAWSGTHTSALSRYLKDHGLLPGEGYGPQKTEQVRFANFPAHSRETFEVLCDRLAGFGGLL